MAATPSATTPPDTTDYVPQVGDLILYQLSEVDCQRVVQVSPVGYSPGGQPNPYTSFGSSEPGLVVPAVITAIVAPGVLNMQLVLDEAAMLWVSARTQGLDPGQWQVRS